MNRVPTRLFTRICSLTNEKRALLDSYPGTVDRSISRAWAEKLKSIELALYQAWEERRVELSRMRKGRLESSIIR